MPGSVRAAMARHHLHRLSVAQYEVAADAQAPLRPTPPAAVASLNTHDMPPFAAFWEGLDLADRQDLGLLDAAGVKQERERRAAIKEALVRFLERRGRLAGPATTRAVLHACLAHVSASLARVVLVNLEDLWLEPRPQNVPGTWQERPNWQRKARHGLEDFAAMPEVVEPLRAVDQLRTTRGDQS